MKPKSTDLALLENALLAIEKVLAHADSNSQQAPSHRLDAGAADSAANVCLSAAAALVDVSRTLISARDERPHDMEREWEAMITYTKIASRSAHRAALIMASQQKSPTTQRAVPADSGERSMFAALTG